MNAIIGFLGAVISHLPQSWVAVASIVRMLEVAVGRIADGNVTSKRWNESYGTSASALYSRVLGRGIDVTSGYGMRRLNGHTHHGGIDIRARRGEAVYPLFDGVVVNVRRDINQRGGRNVEVESLDGSTRYFVCHLSEVDVNVGDYVTDGTVIGKVGGSGINSIGIKSETAYAPHLHMEIRRIVGGKWRSVDPMSYVPESPPVIESSTTSGESQSITAPTSVSRRGRRAGDTDIYNACAYLMSALGLTIDQSCGIIGNLLHESGMNPLAFNNNGGGIGAHGIAQWRGERAMRYATMYGVYPKDDPDTNRQLSYIVTELRTTHAKALERLRKCGTLESSSNVIFSMYEMASDSSLPHRISEANRARSVVRGMTRKHRDVRHEERSVASSHENRIYTNNR